MLESNITFYAVLLNQEDLQNVTNPDVPSNFALFYKIPLQGIWNRFHPQNNEEIPFESFLPHAFPIFHYFSILNPKKGTQLICIIAARKARCAETSYKGKFLTPLWAKNYKIIRYYELKFRFIQNDAKLEKVDQNQF